MRSTNQLLDEPLVTLDAQPSPPTSDRYELPYGGVAARQRG